MSSFQATRRASARSSIVQHPPYTESAFVRLSYICIDRPTTSCPADLRMYAAVDESTPPDMATATFICRLFNACRAYDVPARRRNCMVFHPTRSPTDGDCAAGRVLSRPDRRRRSEYSTHDDRRPEARRLFVFRGG